MSIGKIAVIGIVTGILQAQPVAFGVKAGIPLTDAVEGNIGLHSEERPFTIGPTVELRLPFSFAAEAGALYQRTGYSTSVTSLGVTSTTRVRANAWEFPIVLKYYFPGHELPLRPFVEGGYVLRRLWAVDGVASSLSASSLIPLNSSFLVGDNPTNGVTAGGGLRISLGLLRLSPEVRYTRWYGHAFDETGRFGFLVQSQQNQAQFLLGLSF